MQLCESPPGPGGEEVRMFPSIGDDSDTTMWRRIPGSDYVGRNNLIARALQTVPWINSIRKYVCVREAVTFFVVESRDDSAQPSVQRYVVCFFRPLELISRE